MRKLFAAILLSVTALLAQSVIGQYSISPSASELIYQAGGQPIGPFVHGVNLYAIVANDTSHKTARAMKSTDAGITWAEQNAAGEIAQCNDRGLANGQFAAVQDISAANLIWVFYCAQTGNTSDPINVAAKSFDMSTDTWGPAYIATPSDTSPFGQNSNGYSINANSGAAAPGVIFTVVAAQRPSDGKFVFSFSGTPFSNGGSNYQPMYTGIFDGAGGWSGLTLVAAGLGSPDSPVGVPYQYTPLGAILGAGSRVHFFWGRLNRTTSPLVVEMTGLTVLPDDSNTGMQLITNTVGRASFGQCLFNNFARPWGNPIRRVSGSTVEIHVPFSQNRVQGNAGNFSTNIVMAEAVATSADSPTWATGTVNSVTNQGPISQFTDSPATTRIVALNTDLYALWTNYDSIAGRRYYYSKNSGAGWGAAQIFFSPPANSNLDNIQVGPVLGGGLTAGSTGIGVVGTGNRQLNLGGIPWTFYLQILLNPPGGSIKRHSQIY